MKWVRQKIEAASIQYVLVISVIIIIVLSAFISLVYLQKRIAQKGTLYKETVYHTHQTFDYLAQSEIPYNTLTELTFSEYGNETTQVERRHWGIFDMISVTARLNNEQYRKIGIIGGKNSYRNALYLQDTKKPLVLVGNTQIKGDAALPRFGVKPGSIAGVSYYGSSLVYGNTKLSSSSLPEIQNMRFVREFIRDRGFPDSEEIDLEDGVKLDRSFTESTWVYNSTQSIYLQNIQLEGNIIITSDEKITVHPSAKLQHVLLVAPKVEVLSTTKGTFQVLASEQVSVGTNCVLAYPSAIVVAESKDTKRDQQEEAIKVGEYSQISGVLVYDAETLVSDYNAQVAIERGAGIMGDVYCNKNLELKGSVRGSIVTGNFLARESGRVYVNHLYNAVIDGIDITSEFGGLFMVGTRLAVAKWVY